MTIKLKLLESVSEIEKRVNAAIAEEINKTLVRDSNKIINEIKTVIPSWINKQPEISALLSNELIGQFGTLISPSSIVSSIIESIVQSTSINIKKYNNKLTGGGLELNVQPIDFKNLLNIPEGHTIYRDGDLHWLEWLLLRGDEIIIVGYEYNPKTGLGRTRLGNMIEGRGFRIPPQYSGTSDNNFITRALNGSQQEQDITKIFQKILGA